MRFADQDADLVKVAEKVAEAGGEIILLRGVVTDVQGQPLANARVEIWQVDMNARYLHTGDRARAARDPNFQGYGVAQSDAEGRFVFRTIKPVPYPGRPPHIHAKITAAGRQVTTQFYIKDHPLNARDGSFRRLSAAQKEMVSMSFVATEQGEVADITVIL
jgi:protocatechuate 3,4-dioxygenase beta subunit